MGKRADSMLACLRLCLFRFDVGDSDQVKRRKRAEILQVDPGDISRSDYSNTLVAHASYWRIVASGLGPYPTPKGPV